MFMSTRPVVILTRALCRMRLEDYNNSVKSKKILGKIIGFLTLVAFLGSFSLPLLVHAETVPAPFDCKTTPEGCDFIITPFGGFKDIQSLVDWIVKTLIVIAIPIAVVLIIWSGITYMRSGGDPALVKKAGEILLWTAIGLAIMFVGGGFVDLIFSVVFNAGK